MGFVRGQVLFFLQEREGVGVLHFLSGNGYFGAGAASARSCASWRSTPRSPECRATVSTPLQANEGPGAAGVPGAELRGGRSSGDGPHRQVQGPLSRRHGVPGRMTLRSASPTCAPDAHHRRLRTTNRLERANGQGRRRTKVTPRFPTERSCLTLLYASLIAADLFSFTERLLRRATFGQPQASSDGSLSC